MARTFIMQPDLREGSSAGYGKDPVDSDWINPPSQVIEINGKRIVYFNQTYFDSPVQNIIVPGVIVSERRNVELDLPELTVEPVDANLKSEFEKRLKGRGLKIKYFSYWEDRKH